MCSGNVFMRISVITDLQKEDKIIVSIYLFILPFWHFWHLSPLLLKDWLNRKCVDHLIKMHTEFKGKMYDFSMTCRQMTKMHAEFRKQNTISI